MWKHLLIALLLSASLMSTGCPALIAGAGAGAGVYTYAEGDLTRTYQAPFDKALAAAMETLHALRMTVIEKPTGDAIKSVIKAERSDGTPVTITLNMVSLNITEIGVRSGVVGYWDQKVSKIVHANIAQRLQ
ncbi:MAG: DUF3568 family protein [Desulfobacterales bacterium]|jgi:hypothetical protein